ncbi:MAG: autotransporter domain-containing protein, partial [Gammaproteobacteria bacterium]|nr:autotransporter domain-containing protein [Gammaproteobacteria bacterium]
FTLTLADPGIANTVVGAALTVSITDDEAQPAASPALHETMLPALTRAMAGRQFGAIARRAGAAGRGDGDGVAVWAGGDYRGIEGEDGDTEWDGDMLSFHLGVDGRVGDASRAGLMVSYSDSASDYSAVIDGQFQRGEYELDLTAVSPYWNWRLSDGGAAWASASVGSGEVEVTPDGEAATANDVSMTGVAAGGSWRLRRAGARELRVEADAFVAQTEVEGDDGGGIAEDLEVDANRLRVALALRAPRVLAGGAELTRTVDAGLRHDGGDGRGGAGMEVGGRLRYHNAARGLTVQGKARALLAHSGDQREWGVGGLLRLAPGADGQGFSLTLTPGYGDAEVDLRGLWDNGVAGFDADAGAPAADPQARLAAEVGYGLPVAALASGRAFGFGDAGSFSRGMLTPYTALRLGDSRRDYRLGLRWSTGPRFALDLSARHLNAAATDNTVTLEGRLRF